MDFITLTLNWCKGEIFEGAVAAVFGVVLVICALLFWKVGTTPYSRAMVLPLLAVGALSAVAGVALVLTNQQRLVAFQAAYDEDPTAFKAAELERTKMFVAQYPTTMIVLTVMVIVGLALFHLWTSPMGRSISLCLILLGASAMFGDHFSEERGTAYYTQILQLTGEDP